ncbi:CaiB/BaiF CoA-transferase family protein [Rhodococcus olei]|uniref:CaiB/BaiF CoA-transferase family protein n=1 Tax=Rhodococcus olei TaxID=2161675 RepID=A0ABP8PT94_9NOCA
MVSSTASGGRGGPLNGLKVVEFASIGPGPFCAMLLADLGADVLRIDRPAKKASLSTTDPLPGSLLNRSRATWELDLKDEAARNAVLDVTDKADIVLEGFRPGVMERLGLGPDQVLARNKRLVYGRMTGWGQNGPLAQAAGHDLNYIALSGALSLIGEPGAAPLPPLNYVGDFGGGGMLLAFGVVAATWEAAKSGRGQVVDCAMLDGAAVLSTLFFSLKNAGRWRDQRGANLLDGGAPFYRCYRTADDEFMALAALERPFYQEFAKLAGVECPPDHERLNPANWPRYHAELTHLFATKTRDEWTVLFDGTDACCTPVLSLAEVGGHSHVAARDTLIEVDGVLQPAPAPRFGRTPNPIPTSPDHSYDWRDVIASWGVDSSVVDAPLAGN